ncbi:hypothetical protein P7C70_g4770, partial [Phenoliferia sp. Uapishka_3]
MHTTHSLLVYLQWDESDTDPSTCFNVLDTAILSHHALRTHLCNIKAISKTQDLVSELTQDGLNSFRGMANSPKDHFRTTVTWAVVSSTSGVPIRQVVSQGVIVEPKDRDTTPDWEWKDVTDSEWATSRLKYLAKFSECTMAADFEIPIEISRSPLINLSFFDMEPMTTRDKANREPAFDYYIAQAKDFMVCSGCKGTAAATYYCSPECQKAHWKPSHKFNCRSYVKAVNRREENAMANPRKALLIQRLIAWGRQIGDTTSDVLCASLKLLTPNPMHTIHSLLVYLQWDESDMDPSTCFNVLDTAVLSHLALQTHLRDIGAIRQTHDLVSELTQDGLNSKVVSLGLANTPKERFRVTVTWLVVSSTSGVPTCQVNLQAFGVEPKTCNTTPAWEWRDLTDQEWATSKISRQAL